MAIPKTAPRKIVLVGSEHRIRKELIAGGTITPGHLVAINSAGKYVVHPTAKGHAAPIFAVENDLNGKGIDDNYVANDWVQADILQVGSEVNAIVAAGAAAITAGDYLESAGNGTLRKATAFSQLGSDTYAVTTAGIIVAQALETLDNSGGSDPARLKVMVV
jgi:hypothetical protein